MPDAAAQERIPTPAHLSEPAVETAPGIRTDRLSPRQLRVWETIKRIVFAKDASGRFSHPKLHGLWQWLETSGHVVYMELPDPKDRCDHQAGKFHVEKADPEGERHIAVIRLCLPVIDRARVKERARGEYGFIHYEGLAKEERYAEALGHELAHAVWTLSDRNHSRLIEAVDTEVEEYYSRRREVAKGVARDEQARQHLGRIKSLIGEIEAPADTAEAEIWQELKESGVAP